MEHTFGGNVTFPGRGERNVTFPGRGARGQGRDCFSTLSFYTTVVPKDIHLFFLFLNFPETERWSAEQNGVQLVLWERKTLRKCQGRGHFRKPLHPGWKHGTRQYLGSDLRNRLTAFVWLVSG